MVTCLYDRCCEFEPRTHNAAYCPEHKCKRRRENQVKRLTTPVDPLSFQAWDLQENRKLARAQEKQNKDQWILANKTFAMFDLETSDLNANFGEILCGCIRPLGGPTTTFAIEGTNSDSTIVGAIRDELQKYDYLVTWYGTRFDLPYLTTRLIHAGESTLGMARHIDLYHTAKFKLRLNSNRLATVGDFLFGKTKKDSINGRIWMAALRGDKEALDYIVNHCVKDVAELERVFWKLVPHRNIAETPLRFY